MLVPTISISIAITFVVFLGVGLAAHAAKDKSNAPTGEPKQFKLITKKPIRSLPLFELDDGQTSALSDTAIIIKASPSHSYLLTLSRPCEGLMMGDAIMITNTAGEIEAGFDEVIVGPERERCPIDKIYPIATKKEIEEAREQESAKSP